MLAPPVEPRGVFVDGIAELRAQAFVPPHHVGGEVPVPDRVVGGAAEEREAALRSGAPARAAGPAAASACCSCSSSAWRRRVVRRRSASAGARRVEVEGRSAITPGFRHEYRMTSRPPRKQNTRGVAASATSRPHARSTADSSKRNGFCRKPAMLGPPDGYRDGVAAGQDHPERAAADAPQLEKHILATHPRHRQVEDDQTDGRGVLGEELKAFRAAGRGEDTIAGRARAAPGSRFAPPAHRR